MRVFVLTKMAYDTFRNQIGSPVEGQFTYSVELGLLSSSIGTIGTSLITTVTVSVLNNGSESKYQYWLTKNIEAMFQLGLLPVQKVVIGHASLVRFQSDDGSGAQWHVFNMNCGANYLADGRQFGHNAQYLLISNSKIVDSNVTLFSTIQYPDDLSSIMSGNSAIYTRLQNVMQAFISKGDGTIDDLVFLNHHWALRYQYNTIRLQAYVKSTKQFWTLIAGETPTLVEMDAINTNNSTNLDRKNDTSSDSFGMHSRGYNYLLMPGRITQSVLMFDTLGSNRNSSSFIVTVKPPTM